MLTVCLSADQLHYHCYIAAAHTWPYFLSYTNQLKGEINELITLSDETGAQYFCCHSLMHHVGWVWLIKRS